MNLTGLSCNPSAEADIGPPWEGQKYTTNKQHARSGHGSKLEFEHMFGPLTPSQAFFKTDEKLSEVFKRNGL